MRLTFERKLPIILFFVFLMLTTAGVVFYQSTFSYQDAIAWQRHSKDVSGWVDDTVRLSFEMYTALSNFIQISNPTYLDPFERAKPKARQNIDRLRVLARSESTSAELEAVDAFDQTLQQFVDGVSRKVDLRKSAGLDFPEEEKTWREGQELLGRIRSLGDRIKELETAAQQRRELESDRRFTVTVWILIISSLAGIVSLGVANLTVLSEIKKRRAAQDELIELNEGLEHSIQERTLELKRANEKLLEVGLERESILYSEKEARQEAEIANRLRDEFMATVSHELRTPLNSILGWARMMKGGGLDDSQVDKALTTIIKNSETQTRLIEDLLDVARIISGKLQLNIADLHPGEIVAEAIETVRPAAGNRNVKIGLSIDPLARDAVVEGDHNRLIQVFTNLLGNAVKFSPEGAEVNIYLNVIGSDVSINIRDEGKGIKAEFLPLVFERFRQDSANDSRNGGLGLGLAIVRNLVEMHHGTVKAESEGENKGSTFTVCLPLKADSEPRSNLQ